MDLFTEIEEQYRRFAAAAGDSPAMVRWSLGVADDADVRAWIARLPQLKQQPNLVIAAARWHGLDDDAAFDALRDLLLGDDGRVEQTILARATQTNEAGRMATLMPALNRVPGVADGAPVALVEVGASAGLCLYPDRWSYRWHTGSGVEELGPSDGPWLECRVDALPGRRLDLPTRLPTIAWRGGIDLNPLDITDPDTARWLATLVWPEHHDRRARLLQAAEIAATDPPSLTAGDLLEHLPEVIDGAAAHGTVVVQHSAVIAYLDEPDRARFTEMMRDLVGSGVCHWVSNEGKDVLPDITATGPSVPADRYTFVLGLDGRALAWTHGHGRTMTCVA
ncbi:DUF2332 domain-containing protein [Nocardioides acrostichi]|uniref:DUF2332 domain-containing protein n=1 Tax=Nocardioides acrostichi TaxID=2784339 RepID=A0A930UVT7_9ACTN|nr:DUF2332 domain-containing protein [Nocardioides acrostichi]MBF4161081.1 DUF2332 domain-containing protein [Nocardioides acrostichi]